MTVVAKDAPSARAILVCEDVVRRFGGMVAVDVERLEIEAGKVTALIGPNGAGKTTLFNVVSGFDKPEKGRWSLRGRTIAGKGASATARAGMVRTFQHSRALARMSVVENVMIAAPAQRGERFWSAFAPALWRNQERAIEARARTLVQRFGLSAVQDLKAGALSGGQRKLLDLARAVMAEPALLMLDEPMAGVNPVLREQLLDHIAALRAEGMTVLLIEHDMDAIARIADHVVCLAEGKVIAEGTVDAVRGDPQVIDAYLGKRQGGIARAAPREAAPADVTPAFEARDLVAGYLPGIDILQGCSVRAARGELVGVFGPNGAGKSTLLKTVFGMTKVRGGAIMLAGQSIVGVPAHQLVARGIGYVPQIDAVFAALTVEENLRMGLFQRPERWTARRDAMLDQFPALRPMMGKRADDLSGGERKIVAIARALMMEPDVLLLDEPSAGLSPARQDALFDLVKAVNRTGVTIVIVEQNARQCLAICDRGYVLDRGANAYEGRAADLLADEKVVALYLGTLHRK
ncbi:MAG: ATP-binding cassette domain-containing protein [Alphaproteobacteria bacterium]